MPLFLQTSLGGGVGRLNHEALREEVHCFDGNDHTPIIGISKTQCCSAAMQERHIEMPVDRDHTSCRTLNARVPGMTRQGALIFYIDRPGRWTRPHART